MSTKDHSKPITCPRCHGPATMVDKAPPGESGDVVRCKARCDIDADSITDEQIDRLHTEAGNAGNEKMVRVCERALDGEVASRAECARAIRDALSTGKAGET